MNKTLAKKASYTGKAKFDIIKEFINALSPEKVIIFPIKKNSLDP